MNDKGELNTMRELRDFWLKERPIDPSTGQPILDYIVRSKPWHGRQGLLESVVKARLLDPKTDKPFSKFFAYTEDAFYNANLLLAQRKVLVKTPETSKGGTAK